LKPLLKRRNMKKSASLFILSLFLTIASFAQSIQEGIGHLNAARYASARSNFEKMIAANPNNMEAVYWLGQVYLDEDNVAGARQVYEKALASNGNAPLVLAGMGHVELAEGKTNEARQHFEQAISLSKGKKGSDPNVLNAVGRANVEVRGGDVAYAISKLTEATQLAPNNADILITLGNAYRQAKEGGKAIEYYTKAAQGNAALANYRMALVYKTQRNWDVVLDHLNKAIAADPKFAPAYLENYTYNLIYKNDPAAAEQWAQKYVAVADPSIQNDVFTAQALYQQKKFDEAINVAKNVLGSSKEKVGAGTYRLIAYSYLEKGDTAAARPYVDQLFEKTKADERVGKDVTLKATVYAKEDPSQVVNIYMDAANEDTSLRNKLNILQEAADWAKTTGKKVPEADIRLAIYRLNPSPNPASLFQIGLPYYQGGAYQKADSVFKAYSAAFPDSTFGYLWSARSLGRIDSTQQQGLAIPMYEKLLEVSEKDKARNKAYGVEAAANLATYYVNVKNDRDKGVYYLSKALEFDPENTAFKATIDKLKAPAKPTKPTAPASKPKTTSSSATSKPAATKKG
jgi:tetratricopeptide (TPR) repeat protein